MKQIISTHKSIIPSCDVSDLEAFKKIIAQTHDLPGIGAYKVGFELAIPYGLKRLVEIIRDLSGLPIIYDHQKAGNDIPKMGKKFATACKNSGVDAVILFPFVGPVTEEVWIKECQDAGLSVLVGGHMTHDGFLASNKGSINDNSPEKIYELAISLGITDFVVPGNQPDLVTKYNNLFKRHCKKFTLYAPGFVTQGGDISECGKAAGDNWHAIVGEAIYGASNIKTAAKKLTQKYYDGI